MFLLEGLLVPFSLAIPPFEVVGGSFGTSIKLSKVGESKDPTKKWNQINMRKCNQLYSL